MLSNRSDNPIVSMPSNALIPDRQLTFSPDLAATIGLECAILLQGIGPQLPRSGSQWQVFALTELERAFPFWRRDELQRLLLRLQELGVLLVQLEADGAAIRLPTAENPGVDTSHKEGAQSTDKWQPTEPVLELLALNHGIDRRFALSQLPSFEKGRDDHSRDSRFRQHVLTAWRRRQQQHAAFEVPVPPAFDSDWQPSLDALEIMTRGGIDPEFIDTLRPEFILYWQEKGGPPRDVNSRFISFVRQRWARFEGGLRHSTEPTRIPKGWQPGIEVFDILAMAGISADYARQRLPEFVLYWTDSNEMHTSWNSKFLQHVKHQWRWEQQRGGRHGEQQGSGQTSGATRTRDRSLADDLSDTSWAD